MTVWEKNANYVEKEFGCFVDREERFYICPECGEPVYKEDWLNGELDIFICPICEFTGEEDDE